VQQLGIPAASAVHSKLEVAIFAMQHGLAPVADEANA
jgi:hypothetical protein